MIFIAAECHECEKLYTMDVDPFNRPDGVSALIAMLKSELEKADWIAIDTTALIEGSKAEDLEFWCSECKGHG